MEAEMEALRELQAVAAANNPGTTHTATHTGMYSAMHSTMYPTTHGAAHGGGRAAAMHPSMLSAGHAGGHAQALGASIGQHAAHAPLSQHAPTRSHAHVHAHGQPRAHAHTGAQFGGRGAMEKGGLLQPDLTGPDLLAILETEGTDWAHPDGDGDGC
eukprot:332329-Pleurochrysis_carterae.AAC.1